MSFVEGVLAVAGSAIGFFSVKKHKRKPKKKNDKLEKN